MVPDLSQYNILGQSDCQSSIELIVSCFTYCKWKLLFSVLYLAYLAFLQGKDKQHHTEIDIIVHPAFPTSPSFLRKLHGFQTKEMGEYTYLYHIR